MTDSCKIPNYWCPVFIRRKQQLSSWEIYWIIKARWQHFVVLWSSTIFCGSMWSSIVDWPNYKQGFHCVARFSVFSHISSLSSLLSPTCSFASPVVQLPPCLESPCLVISPSLCRVALQGVSATWFPLSGCQLLKFLYQEYALPST